MGFLSGTGDRLKKATSGGKNQYGHLGAFVGFATAAAGEAVTESIAVPASITGQGDRIRKIYRDEDEGMFNNMVTNSQDRYERGGIVDSFVGLMKDEAVNVVSIPEKMWEVHTTPDPGYRRI